MDTVDMVDEDLNDECSLGIMRGMTGLHEYFDDISTSCDLILSCV
jgi:hypothetical protein